jgi:aryl-alcohol dehydrogenase-like predicted oxidoreductase
VADSAGLASEVLENVSPKDDNDEYGERPRAKLQALGGLPRAHDARQAWMAIGWVLFRHAATAVSPEA